MTTIKALFSAECRFIAGASSLEQIPQNVFMPEVAFVGRSNVGKSSLINAVVGERDCARVSKLPGRTQQINFFTLQEKISISDLPGYGYAAVSKKTRRSWDHLILDYLRGRQNLRRIFLLIDSRHGIKKNDDEIMDILDESAVVYQLILTKIDKNPHHREVLKQMEEQIATRVAAFPYVIPTSAEKKIGIESLQMEMVSLINNQRN
ncbi:MAG: ribosome biogenesis GTP-binding protein YihA/YsxC [Holosporaceae bacterium]|jgi:GTP-binding protein|nr:ribosome biogenesis GTP-binding protein YihA/YsxC [Holosporaceae bacterium]